MEDQNKAETFSYTYSAVEMTEVRNIREKYVKKDESGLDALRRLDRAVTQKATVASLVIGIVGALVMGTGMSLAMVFGQGNALTFGIGVCVGVIGMVLVALAYPLYSHVLRRERERVAPEILRITEELLK